MSVIDGALAAEQEPNGIAIYPLQSAARVPRKPFCSFISIERIDDVSFEREKKKVKRLCLSSDDSYTHGASNGNSIVNQCTYSEKWMGLLGWCN